MASALTLPSPYNIAAIIVALVALGVEATKLAGVHARIQATNDDDEEDAMELLLLKGTREVAEYAALTVELTTTTSDADEASNALKVAAKQIVMRIVAQLTSEAIPGVRANVFLISTDGTQMTRIAEDGRENTSAGFTQDDDRGRRAFATLARDNPYLYAADTLDVDKALWAGTGEHYRTFIAAPIRRNPIDDETREHTAYGLLTVDAAEPNSLNEARHAKIVAMFASELAIFCALANTRS